MNCTNPQNLGKRMLWLLPAAAAILFAACGDEGSSNKGVDPADDDVVELSSSSVNDYAEDSSSSKSKEKSSSSVKGEKKSSSSVAQSSSSAKDEKVKSSESKDPEPADESSSSSTASGQGSSDEESSSSENQSSSSIAYGWSWEVPKEMRLNPEINYDSMVDPRDGKVYKTVKIGNQVWMAENLNYYDEQNPLFVGSSWCYGDDDAHCDVTGRLYTWSAAKSACPPDWHLPETDEWRTMFDAVGHLQTLTMEDDSLKSLFFRSQTGWVDKQGQDVIGLDSVGFSALPAGCRGGHIDEYGSPRGFCKGTQTERYSGDGRWTGFWSASLSFQEQNDQADFFFINRNQAGMDIGYVYFKGSSDPGDAFSVRCVQDEN
jgi:uncharacterized protein (TIGR02145 family)